MTGDHDQRQKTFFCSFDLDEAVQDDHLVRRTVAVLDPGWIRETPEPHYANTGRRSIDSVLMLRILVPRHVLAVHPERQLAREAQVNVAYCWYCGPGPENRIPDYFALSYVRITTVASSQ